MKAERRHELHQNDLAQWLSKMAQWGKAHGNHLTAGVLIVALGFFAWMLIGNHLQSRKDAVPESFRQAMMVADMDQRLVELKEVAEQDRSPFWAAKASLDVGNLYALKLVSADKTDAAQQQEWTDQATKFYTRAADVAAGHPGLESLAAQGYLGLGQLAANARRFDDAEALYRKALATAPEGYPAHTYAEAVLRELPHIRTAPETFAAAPPAAEFLTPPVGPRMETPPIPGLMLPEVPYGDQ